MCSFTVLYCHYCHEFPDSNQKEVRLKLVDTDIRTDYVYVY